MTHKEQFKAEIEKVKLIIQSNRAQGAFTEGYLIGQESVLEHFENFVNSMQEEPVSEPINFEQELYKAFGQVKDFTLGIQIAKWFYDIGKNSQEPVSKDLEEASKNYALNNTPWDDCKDEIQESFRVGAKWQKEQMMNGAVDGEIRCYYDYGYCAESEGFDAPARRLSSGDKVKLIIIKED